MTSINRIPKKAGIIPTRPPTKTASVKSKAKSKTTPKSESKGESKGSSKGSKSESKGEASASLDPARVALLEHMVVEASISREGWAEILADPSQFEAHLTNTRKRKHGAMGTKKKRNPRHPQAPKKHSNSYSLFKNSAGTKEQFPNDKSGKERHAAWKKHEAANSATFIEFTELAASQKAKFQVIQDQFETMYLGKDATDKSKGAYLALRVAYEDDRSGNGMDTSEDGEEPADVEDENEDAEDGNESAGSDEDEEVEEPAAKRQRTEPPAKATSASSTPAKVPSSPKASGSKRASPVESKAAAPAPAVSGSQEF